MTQRTTSLLTGKSNLEHLHTIKDFPVFMGCIDHPESRDLKSEMSFSICKDTGIIQLDKLIPLDLVYQAQHNDGVGKVWLDHYTEFSAFLAKFSPQSILEIGGASGTIAKIFTENYPDTRWIIVEPNPTYHGNAQIKVIKDWFDDQFTLHESVDTIVHSHVIEHIYDPVKFLEHIAEFLKPGDKHIFTFPNMIALLDAKYTNCLNFEHTAFLAEPFIDHALKNAGFGILEKKYFQDHSIFYATEKLSEKPKIKFYPNYYENYKKLFNNFITYHENLIANLNVETEKFDGPVFLFGAHIFSQYLLAFGLNNKNIKGIIDNSILKNKKRLYGTSFSIDFPDIIMNLPSVAVILKVAAYRDEIAEQLLKLNPRVVLLEGK